MQVLNQTVKNKTVQHLKKYTVTKYVECRPSKCIEKVSVITKVKVASTTVEGVLTVVLTMTGR